MKVRIEEKQWMDVFYGLGHTRDNVTRILRHLGLSEYTLDPRGYCVAEPPTLAARLSELRQEAKELEWRIRVLEEKVK